jgi:hypothetical protein
VHGLFRLPICSFWKASRLRPILTYGASRFTSGSVACTPCRTLPDGRSHRQDRRGRDQSVSPTSNIVAVDETSRLPLLLANRRGRRRRPLTVARTGSFVLPRQSFVRRLNLLVQFLHILAVESLLLQIYLHRLVGNRVPIALLRPVLVMAHDACRRHRSIASADRIPHHVVSAIDDLGRGIARTGRQTQRYDCQYDTLHYHVVPDRSGRGDIRVFRLCNPTALRAASRLLAVEGALSPADARPRCQDGRSGPARRSGCGSRDGCGRCRVPGATSRE